MRKTMMLMACLAGGAPLLAHAQNLTTLDDDMVGPRTQMLVLGSVHLRERKEFKGEGLGPLLDRLAAFKPQVITIEAIGGEQCDLAARHPTVYGEDYCRSTDKAKAATGLDIPAAIAGVNKALAAWPANPAPAQRRHLAALFLAASDPASAYVQWLRLPAGERRVGDGLDETLVQVLRELETRNNESFQIGARLAARLGLERVHPIDDHTGDSHQIADTQAFGEAVMAAWKTDRTKLEQAIAEQDRLIKAPDLLPLYRYINQPEVSWIYAENNLRGPLRAESPQHYPQIWVNGWEIRNLRMVANILETVRDRPGQRVLNIVGASHKPWFDQWLGQMPGVSIVDVQAVLK
ncbi:DUF5694 domain-containing protein [Pseudoxanthomonas japonensis]|nr:DUF5694 domain-containing protein [Pseudoxanthomonas japonensis]